MSVLKNILAIIGLLAILLFFSNLVSTPSGTGWSWAEESRVHSKNYNDSYISIERGKHRDAVDRVKVVLIVNDKRRELWSSYMKTEPVVGWLKANTIGISYIKGESHSYFPQVTVGERTYDVLLTYK